MPKQSVTQRRQILPVLWLKRMQGMMSRMFGFRTTRTSRGVHSVGYFEGIQSEKGMKDLARRRAKNKVARRSRRINRIRAKK